MKKAFYFLVLIFTTLGCIFPSRFFSESTSIPTEQSPQGTDCTNINITATDRDYALEYGSELFSESIWERTYTEYPAQFVVNYISSSLSAVGVIKIMAFCNPQQDIKTYASEENLAVILSNYEEYEQVASCEQDDILLFQFTARSTGENYEVKLWLAPLNDLPYRAVEIFFTFLQDEPANNMEKYSSFFFPDFLSCK